MEREMLKRLTLWNGGSISEAHNLATEIKVCSDYAVSFFIKIATDVSEFVTFNTSYRSYKNR